MLAGRQNIKKYLKKTRSSLKFDFGLLVLTAIIMNNLLILYLLRYEKFIEHCTSSTYAPETL